MKTLKINFENQQALKHFAIWLCEQGEDSYRIWMECREQEESGNITAKEFIYHEQERFVPNNEIDTVCGRITK